MKQNRGRQAASVVAPNLVIVDIARYRWRSYVFRWGELVHQMIADDLDQCPRMMEADIPPDPDSAIALLLRQLQRYNPAAPASDDLHAGATIEEPVQRIGDAPTVASRSFWSYAEAIK